MTNRKHLAEWTALPPPTLTVEEAARILAISRKSAYLAVARGEIPSVRIGRRIVVPTHRLIELLNGSPRNASGRLSRPSATRGSHRAQKNTTAAS